MGQDPLDDDDVFGLDDSRDRGIDATGGRPDINKTGSAASKEVTELIEVLTKLITDPAVAIERPHVLIDYLVRQHLKLFQRLTGRKPRLLYVPQAIEAALQIDIGRTGGRHERDAKGRLIKLRDRDMVQEFGCQVVWDAKEFKVE